MMLTFAAGLAVGAVLVCSGVFAAMWRRERTLASLPALAAGSAVCMAAASRFAGPRDAVTGQELATLISVFALAAAIVGAAWTRGGLAR